LDPIHADLDNLDTPGVDLCRAGFTAGNGYFNAPPSLDRTLSPRSARLLPCLPRRYFFPNPQQFRQILPEFPGIEMPIPPVGRILE
jgi:hypothetical protein